MRTIIICAMLFSSPVLAQQAVLPPPVAPTPPSLVLEPSDAAELREIVETTIPMRYTGGITRWYNGLLQKQMAKQTPAIAEQPK